MSNKFINDFMNELFNYGGVIMKRGNIIQEVYKTIPDKKSADWFLFCFFENHKSITSNK